MQNRMKENPLSATQIVELLQNCQVGTISTLMEDGRPYSVPIHFALYNNKLYLHGLPRGQKIDNIKKDNRVCFETFEMAANLLDDVDTACEVNTVYRSVVILGTAAILENYNEKEAALNAIVQKYTPRFAGKKLPENMINGTAVIEITPTETTGKYYGEFL